jgi:hypothetical protein
MPETIELTPKIRGPGKPRLSSRVLLITIEFPAPPQ